MTKAIAECDGKSAKSYLVTFQQSNAIITHSGVFKGRRARHLPRAPPFLGPPLQVLRAYIFVIFGEKRIIHSYNGLQSRS